jgi:tetratricopeptide (TPR) repeat protein
MSTFSEITNENIYNSTITNSVTQILSNYEEYEEWKRDLDLWTETLTSIPKTNSANRSKLQIKINSLKERIINYEKHLEKTLGEIKVDLEYQEKAILALQEGHAKQAKDFLLEQSMYINEIEKKANDKLQEVTKAKSDIANHFLLLALVTQTDYANPNHFQETRDFFERSIAAYENEKTLDSYAHYLFINNQHSEAFIYYQRIIKNYSDKLSKHDLAVMLANVAVIQTQQRDYAQALDLYKQVAVLWNEINEEIDDSLILEKAKIFNNLALLHRQMNNYEEALETYKESLSLLYDLSSKEPIKYQQDIAKTLNNLAVLSRNKHNFKNAMNYYSQAIEIQRNLVKENLQYLPDLAMSLGNSGVLLYQQEKFEDSSNILMEALKIYENLTRQNPQKYLLEMIKICKNTGVLYYKTGNLTEATRNLEKAKALLLKHFNKQHADSSLELANVRTNLSVIYRLLNRHEEAIKESKKALSIYKKILPTNSTEYLFHKAKILNNLGLMYGDTKDYTKALKSFEEAIKIQYYLVKLNPETYCPDLAGSLINISLFYQNIIKKPTESIKYAIEALVILLPTVEEVPFIQDYYVSALAILNECGISDEEIQQLIDEKMSLNEENTRVDGQN